jgi:hypothetical protein
MRDYIIVIVLCLIAALVMDRIWLDGKYTGQVAHQVGLDISSVNRR